MKFKRTHLELIKMSAKEEQTTRGFLKALLISPRGTLATDGYRMVRLENRNRTKFKPFFISRRAAQNVIGLLNRMKPANREASLEIERNKDRFKVTIGTENTKESVGMTGDVLSLNFSLPGFDSVLPKSEPRYRILISANTIKKMADTLRACGAADSDYGSKVIEFFFWGKEDPFYAFTYTNNKERLEFIAMPYADKRDFIEFVPPKPWFTDNES